VGFMVNKWASEAGFFFSPGLFSFLCLSTNPAFSHVHMSLHLLLCGSTDHTAHYHLLKIWVLGFTCWWHLVIHPLVFLIFNL
jgi:hypothetical protein